MKKYSLHIVAAITLLLFSCSGSKDGVQTKFPQKIESVYFKKWFGGRPETGYGTNLFLTFEKPLNPTVKLLKIYFQNHETLFSRQENNTYIAFFITKPSSDWEPNKKETPRFILKENEAVLEYTFKGGINFYKINNIKEKDPDYFE